MYIMDMKTMVSVSPVSDFAPHKQFVSVTKSMGHMKSEQMAWRFRLLADASKYAGKGWNFAFLTLTYGDDTLPRIRREYFREDLTFNELRRAYEFKCFDKNHIRKLVKFLKNYLYRTYKTTEWRYMFVSEYGKSTNRPHYHGILMLPPFVDVRKFYDKIHSFWNTFFGFVFPRPEFYDGGNDAKGIYHEPFCVPSERVSSAVTYISKYMSKDIGFCEQFPKDLLKTDQTNGWRDHLPFHYQTKKLGYEFLAGMSDAEKMQLMKLGAAFFSSENFIPLPVYLRNKILFNNKYVFTSSGKRLVRREATQFLLKNYKEIYDLKVQSYEKVFEKLHSSAYLLSCGATPPEADKMIRLNNYFEEKLAYFRSISKDLNEEIQLMLNIITPAKYYVTYYGVPYLKTFCTGGLDGYWLLRYCPNMMKWSMYKPLPKFFTAFFDAWCSLLSFNFGFVEKRLDELKKESYAFEQMVSDYYSQIKE